MVGCFHAGTPANLSQRQNPCVLVPAAVMALLVPAVVMTVLAKMPIYTVMAEADRQRLAVWAHSEPFALHPQCRLQDMDSGAEAGTESLQTLYTCRDFVQSHQANFPIVSPDSPVFLSPYTPVVCGLQLFPRPPGYPTILSWSLLGARTLARHCQDDDDDADDDRRVAWDSAKHEVTALR